jgi:ribosomal protein S19
VLSVQRFDWLKRDSGRRAYKGVNAQKYERKKTEPIKTFVPIIVPKMVGFSTGLVISG